MLTLGKVKAATCSTISAPATGALLSRLPGFGIRAVGFEIDPGLINLARENARQQGVEKLVEFREQDFLTANLSQHP